jgi:hypothetical protein
MPIFKITVRIADGDNRYDRVHLVFASAEKLARGMVIHEEDLCNRKMFAPFERHEDGMVYRWQEIFKGGYRIFEICDDLIEPYRMKVLGLNVKVDANELMHRPCLPLKSSEASWLWKMDDRREYWWYQCDTVVACDCMPAEGDTDDVHIHSFPYWDIGSWKKQMESAGWTLVKGCFDTEV